MARDTFRIAEHGDGGYFLSFDDFGTSPAVEEAFEEAGYEGEATAGMA